MITSPYLMLIASLAWLTQLPQGCRQRERAALSEKYNAWGAAEPARYSYTLEVECGGVDLVSGPFRVQAVRDSVTQMGFLDGHDTLPENQGNQKYFRSHLQSYSIERIFGVAGDYINLGGEFEISYDSVYSFPKDLATKLRERNEEGCTEVRRTVTDFREVQEGS